MGEGSATIRTAAGDWLGTSGHDGDGMVRLGVLGTGFDLVNGHYEYSFQVLHPWGWNWKVKRRYNELLSFHEDLSLDSQLLPLPAFPPKHTISERLWKADRDVATKRIMEFQTYLQTLTGRPEIAQNPSLQRVLGVVEPKAPICVKVVKWDQDPCGNSTAQLDVQLAEDKELGTCDAGLTEAIEVFVRVLQPPAQALEANGKTFMSIYRQPVRISGLPPGREVEFEVRAKNSVGTSPPALVQIVVPCLFGGDDDCEPIVADRTRKKPKDEQGGLFSEDDDDGPIVANRMHKKSKEEQVGLFDEDNDDEAIVADRTRKKPKEEQASLFSDLDSNLFAEQGASKSASQRSS